MLYPVGCSFYCRGSSILALATNLSASWRVSNQCGVVSYSEISDHEIGLCDISVTVRIIRNMSSMKFRVEVFKELFPLYSADVNGALELGRQDAGEPNAVALVQTNGKQRLIIADHGVTALARHQLHAELLQDGTLRMTNLSKDVPVKDATRQTLEKSATRVYPLPTTFVFPAASLSVKFDRCSSESDPEFELQSLATKTMAPGTRLAFSESLSDSVNGELPQEIPQLDRIVQGLREAMEIYQNVRTEEALYDAAVTGAVKLCGFDGAKLLRLSQGTWQEVRQFGTFHTEISQFVLRQVLKQTKTLWNSGRHEATESLLRLEAVIAVPILDRAGTVIGALYGERRSQIRINARRMITQTDAQLMEILAFGVASEISRQKQEEESRRLQVRFEQFFSPELARELEAQPDLLEGRDVEVSILFCDIRGFSRISERVDTKTIFRFINEVIGACSECVISRGGVLVDYVGDAVMAMWGAPQIQENHAELACLTAIDILERLPALNSEWESKIGEEVHFSIGINSGPARAGNAGSDQKFKYGPLGKTVNLASRVQGATKYFKNQVLVTRTTADQVRDKFNVRKLCDARVINVHEPVGLCELSREENQKLKRVYENALKKFETGEFRIAARLLSHLLEEFPEDGPTQVLLSRCVKSICDGPDPEHPILILKHK